MSDKTFNQDHVNAIVITTIIDCIHIVKNKDYENEYTADMIREMNKGIGLILENNNLTLESK